jgi:hypothetical protein
VTNFAVELFADVILFSVIGFNITITRKLRRSAREMKALTAEMKQFNRDKFPMMIDALERLANTVCPLCAMAAGEATGDCNGEPMNPDAEFEGQHIIHVRGGQGQTPCRAADIRANARELFEEAFGEREGLTVMQVKKEA